MDTNHEMRGGGSEGRGRIYEAEWKVGRGMRGGRGGD